MTRYQFCRLTRRILRLHYDVQVTGREVLYDGNKHLVLPNHTAFVDPLIIAGEFYDIPLRPMVDERFMRHPVYGRIVRLGDPVEVPDLQKSSMSRQEGAEAAAQLSRIAIEQLKAGNEMLFYPSGHIKLVDKEIIGNRRMAYEVCRDLPEGVHVVLLRMRGLEGSRWSKLKPKNHKWRRTVTLHLEDKTEALREWANTLTRREFNIRLEDWYNQTV